VLTIVVALVIAVVLVLLGIGALLFSEAPVRDIVAGVCVLVAWAEGEAGWPQMEHGLNTDCRVDTFGRKLKGGCERVDPS
jgi:hypothetical protein